MAAVVATQPFPIHFRGQIRARNLLRVAGRSTTRSLLVGYSLTSVTDGTRTFRGCRNRGIMPPYAPISWKISRSVYAAIRAGQASLAAAAHNSG